MTEIYYIGNKAKDYYDFDYNDISKYESIGNIIIDKVYKTFVRGNIEFNSNYGNKKWYREYIKGRKGFFYAQDYPLFDTIRIENKTKKTELYFANLDKINSEKAYKIFIAMPFDEKLEDTFDAIKQVGDKLRKEFNDIEIFRLDMHEGESVELPREIYKNISESGIIITDLTYQNANVYYELGIADALKKRVIQICKTTDDLKFDVAHKKSIIFPNLKILKNKLERDIRAIYNSKTL